MAGAELSRSGQAGNQCHLDISHTESVAIESEGAEETKETAAETVPKFPSSTTKRGRKLRVSPEVKFENLPVTEEVILIEFRPTQIGAKNWIQANPDKAIKEPARA